MPLDMKIALDMHNKLNKAGRDYFNGRGISDVVISSCLLGYDGKSRLSIPGFIDGELYGIQYRATPKLEQWAKKEGVTLSKYISHAGGFNKFLYNTEVIFDGMPYLLIWESPLDCLAARSLGYPAIARFCGNQRKGNVWSPEWTKLLKGVTNRLIVPNNDEPGEVIGQSLNVSVHGSKIVALPKKIGERQIKDFTDFVQADLKTASARTAEWLGFQPCLPPEFWI